MQSTSVNEHSSCAIKVRNLRKKYGRFNALDGISFDVHPNEIFGFLGTNGSGKTTTIKCITTLTKQSEGSIEIFGINTLLDADRVRQNIGYVPQSLSLISELSGYENLLLYSKLYGVPKHNRHQNILHILELLGINERGNDEVYKYSGGMMRRLEIGTAIVHNPPLMVLDEPTIGLDPQGRQIVWKLLRHLVHEFGTTIFMTTHDMSEADDLCDRIAIVNHGKIIVIDSPTNLKRNVMVEEQDGDEVERGGNVIMIKTLSNPLNAISILNSEMAIKAKIVDQQYLRLVLKDVKSVFPKLLSTFVKAGIEIESIDIQKPTFDDVFLKYAGTKIPETESQGEDGWKNLRNIRRRFR